MYGKHPVALLLGAERIDELLLERRNLFDARKEDEDGVGRAVKGLLRRAK
jgi:hypothetical protein